MLSMLGNEAMRAYRVLLMNMLSMACEEKSALVDTVHKTDVVDTSNPSIQMKLLNVRGKEVHDNCSSSMPKTVLEVYQDSPVLMVADDVGDGSNCMHVRMGPENLCMCLPFCLNSNLMFSFFYLKTSHKTQDLFVVSEEKLKPSMMGGCWYYTENVE